MYYEIYALVFVVMDDCPSDKTNYIHLCFNLTEMFNLKIPIKEGKHNFKEYCMSREDVRNALMNVEKMVSEPLYFASNVVSDNHMQNVDVIDSDIYVVDYYGNDLLRHEYIFNSERHDYLMSIDIVETLAKIVSDDKTGNTCERFKNKSISYNLINMIKEECSDNLYYMRYISLLIDQCISDYERHVSDDDGDAKSYKNKLEVAKILNFILEESESSRNYAVKCRNNASSKLSKILSQDL